MQHGTNHLYSNTLFEDLGSLRWICRGNTQPLGKRKKDFDLLDPKIVIPISLPSPRLYTISISYEPHHLNPKLSYVEIKITYRLCRVYLESKLPRHNRRNRPRLIDTKSVLQGGKKVEVSSVNLAPQHAELSKKEHQALWESHRPFLSPDSIGIL